MPPRTEATPAKPTEEPSAAPSNTVRLATVFPSDGLDPSIDGVPVITADGTDVPVEHEEAIRKAANSSGVKIRKVS